MTATRPSVTLDDIRATMIGRFHPHIRVVRRARNANGDDYALMAVGPDYWIGQRQDDRVIVWAYGQYDILANRDFEERLNAGWKECDAAHPEELVAA
jgi:hypothetical protein